MPGKDELPETLKRSPKKAQRTWVKTHDSAVETYGEGEAAHRTAFSAVAASVPPAQREDRQVLRCR